MPPKSKKSHHSRPTREVNAMSCFHDYVFALPTLILVVISLLLLLNEYPSATLALLGAILMELLFQNTSATIMGAIAGWVIGWVLAKVRHADPVDQFPGEYFGSH
jgi:hypothetical protein